MKVQRAILAGLAACLLLATGCGEDNASSGNGTVFECPTRYCSALGDAVGNFEGSSTDTTSQVPTTFRGVRATVDGIADPWIVPEDNVIDQTTALTQSMTAIGTADNPDVVITMVWTVAATINPPDTLALTLTPPGTNSAQFFYAETVTSGAQNPVTAIVSGELDLKRWSDVSAEGTFDAQVILQDGASRTIADGIIDVRFQD